MERGSSSVLASLVGWLVRSLVLVRSFVRPLVGWAKAGEAMTRGGATGASPPVTLPIWVCTAPNFVRVFCAFARKRGAGRCSAQIVGVSTYLMAKE